jgi:uncharacterized membrane protein YjgN (DUF898 family)
VRPLVETALLHNNNSGLGRKRDFVQDGYPRIWGSETPDAPTPATNAAETLRFAFVKRPGLLKITIVNFLLGMITLGIYRFWGKTRVRQHIWSSVHLNEEPLEYTGTGMELFKGFLIVLVAVLLPASLLISAMTTIYGPESTQYYLTTFALAVLAQFFVGYALYSSRHYQLTRTNWRGIRGALIGSPMRYSLTYFGSMLAKLFSLGWATPVMNTLLQEQMIGDMKFGDAAFKFKGRAGPLYPTYAMCWFLSLAAAITVPTLAWYGIKHGLGLDIQDVFEKVADPAGTVSEQMIKNLLTILAIIGTAFVVFMIMVPMLWSIYTAKELRTFAEYSRFDGAPFRFDATTSSIIWLTVVNVFILVFTLGVGQPFIQRRSVKYVIDRTSLNGLVDIDRIRQSTARGIKMGDGLADAFELGTI